MYLEKISLYNFRQFGIIDDASPGITVHLNPKFNVLVGENDSGKTAIIDGIRYLLGSVSDDFEKISQEDFYSSSKDIYSDQFFIEGIFTDLSDKEAGAFLEWLSFDAKNNYTLRLILRVEKRKNENGIEYIDRRLLAGDDNFESRLDSEAKNLLKTTYLKPLRDASSELKPGFRSRLVHILKAHPTFKKNEEQNHKLVEVMEMANKEIEKYFESEYIDGHSLINDIENLLSSFYDNLDQSKSKAKFAVTNSDLTSILRKLSLNTEDVNLGLGNLNLLFIATELLLLNNYVDNDEIVGPKITLIEEIEAHLHTQAQIRLIKFLENELEQEGNKSQFILTSHSSNLVASVDPKNIILIHKQRAYPMNDQYTLLKQEDYKFLERFLDSTKSNLFFAKGIIFVEGESEMLLLPALASLIGYPLHQSGVSIVNVRGTSFERYIKLFSRSTLWTEEMQLPTLDVPVSIVTDADIKPYIYYEFEDMEKPFFNIEDEAKLDEILPHIAKSKEKLRTDYIGVDYSTLRKLAKDFGFEVTKENEDILTFLIKKEITEDYISSIDSFKRGAMVQHYNTYDCNLNVSIAPQWTLEFSLALSVLAKLLYRSIHINRYQKPLAGHKKKEYYDMVKEIEEEKLSDKDKKSTAYKIFKPVNDGLVSKAEVAQTLAIYIDRLIKENPAKAQNLKNQILRDGHLSYLVDAIMHASNAKPLEVEVTANE
ncbi:ATP-dependent nuclease [Cytobacillus horneckiae]|uniref:ATP-dependent nuclease n=1 Tax=Cytobacillus horneckiae TaxID=549687 RepID=UPI0020419CDA|nr:AAA family ATPase [Cytobacillus horneckiae]MCM3181170.1 AAA family ATPase [Cytobacillus horneckiae]